MKKGPHIIGTKFPNFSPRNDVADVAETTFILIMQFN